MIHSPTVRIKPMTNTFQANRRKVELEHSIFQTYEMFECSAIYNSILENLIEISQTSISDCLILTLLKNKIFIKSDSLMTK